MYDGSIYIWHGCYIRLSACFYGVVLGIEVHSGWLHSICDGNREYHLGGLEAFGEILEKAVP